MCETNLKALQEELKRKGIKAYYITGSDEHNSEYVPYDYLKERLFYCPFTGTDGTLLVTDEEAYLFTDGRYFVQAEKELEGSSVKLMKMRTAGYPTLEQLVHNKNLYPLAFDFKRISVTQARLLENGNSSDIINENFSYLFPFEIESPKGKVWEVTKELCKLDRNMKIAAIRNFMPDSSLIDGYLISDLASIAYVLNLRGSDIKYTPVFYAFLYITATEVHLFIDKEKLSEVTLEGINIHEYEDIYDFINSLRDDVVLYDDLQTNYAISKGLGKSVTGINPVDLVKCIKDEVEVKNIKEVHILDGVAMVKFIKYLYEHKNDGLSEYQLAEVLEKFRREEKKCFDLSFSSIVAVDANAAEMHYSPTAENSSIVDDKSQVLLVDSGGQYYGGTTDITRTFILGEASEELRRDYTLTLKAMINLSDTVFIEGCSGTAIDIKAREIMWREGLDYKCGTGHGVGYMLGVHEGPNSFRYYVANPKRLPIIFEPNMITTVEPGVYKAGKHGIRIENELLCVPLGNNGEDNFLTFECITCCPIETKGLVIEMLGASEIEYINGYNEWVCSRLAPLLDDEHVEFLREICKPIIK